MTPRWFALLVPLALLLPMGAGYFGAQDKDAPRCIAEGQCIDLTDTEFCDPGPYFCTMALEGDETTLDEVGRSRLREEYLAGLRALPECGDRDASDPVFIATNGCSHRSNPALIMVPVPALVIPSELPTRPPKNPVPEAPTMTLPAEHGSLPSGSSMP